MGLRLCYPNNDVQSTERRKDTQVHKKAIREKKGFRAAYDALKEEYDLENFTELYNLVHLHLPFSACLPTISDMCREIDEFIASMGTRPLQFIPAKAGAAASGNKKPGRTSASRKFGKKKQKK